MTFTNDEVEAMKKDFRDGKTLEEVMEKYPPLTRGGAIVVHYIKDLPKENR